MSQGQVSRRDLIKLGLFTAAGTVILKNGLSPFAGSALADSNIPTGLPRSPLFGVQPFSQPMPRFDVIPKFDVGHLKPAPTKKANTTQQPLNAALEGVKPGDTGPIEGRPGGDIWAHQGFEKFPPTAEFELFELGARDNNVYNPGVDPEFNSHLSPGFFPGRFHPKLPEQNEDNVWTFNGTFPPKLVQICYGESAIMRIHNQLPFDVKRNAGFGRHTTSIHKHNAHHGAENDGFTGAYFYPGQFYDYHWPIVLAGFETINTDATRLNTGGFDHAGKPVNVAGDFCETMSTHWFHDHMFSFTSQNVYKGLAGMINIYSTLDSGNEVAPGTGDANLRLPSGSTKAFGNLEYDVNLMLADKAWDANGQMTMDIFEFDGFLGDQILVNLAYKPYFEVERRKYRFRILNGAVSRFFKIAFTDANGNPKQMIQIGNDGNLLPQVVPLTQLDEIGIAERYDIVIDFTQFQLNDRAYFVNVAEHGDGRRPAKFLSVAEATSGKSPDPGVGKFLEFRVVRPPTGGTDPSQVPDRLIQNPDLSGVPVTRERVFEFGNGGKQTSRDPDTSFIGPWGVKTDGGDMLDADFGRITAAPKFGTREIWTLKNGGGGWDHPIHIHFEEGQILARNGSPSNVPAWEKGRKDVYRLRPSGSVTITMQFRDWGGMFMEHCHNTVHEDNAMLMRWEIDQFTGNPTLRPLPTPVPTPQGVTFRDPDDILRNAF